jgi:tyrosine-protein kinase Etk/Wzc
MNGTGAFYDVVRLESTQRGDAATDSAPPVLGTVPTVLRRVSGSARRYATDDTAASVRDVRGALQLLGENAHPFRLTLSSMALGAGASFVAVQLARSFATAGFRTLLVDGDVHRGTLHREVGMARRPGLTDYLRGESTAQRIVRPTMQRGLSFIACGKRVSNASALLGSPALVALLSQFEEDFDVVLCDSAPFTAGADPFVLGARTGHLLVVLRSGVSPRVAADAAHAWRDSVPVDLLGVVMTRSPRVTTSADRGPELLRD